ncbi:KAP family P-loop NTPase fold protein [Achromobacter pulmonis]|uniref:KAP family P-loop NTPase fold protein n=1 Tax=Achromobacter pulmonis TaxID=1389932 RepID=UPI001F26D540|nr:P-loop NTPase fold protein [Achromobacter pulmonis]MCF7771224.1 KAP family NTPase [Achromobacter pulmonis]
MSQHAEAPPNDPWHDDVLDRRNLAEMLENHLLVRFRANNGAPLSIALDARWGSGKTFFVNRWTAQLRANKCCVIEFDAWQHDQSTAPALAFMAEISRQVKQQTALIVDTDATAKAIERALSETVSSVKRAAKPVGKALLNTAIKKLIGLSISEIAEVASEGDAAATNGSSADNAVNRALDQAIDKYLDELMADHELRHASVEKFRQNLEGLAGSLAKASRGPVFVVIDELDRCRPNFAVQLLEAVKHLFSVRNVCFVFSTNLSQLAASVQAVYGPNFDGRDYLGRFFDQELRLPLPSGDQFAKLLFQQASSPSTQRWFYGSFTFPQYSNESNGMGIWTGLCHALNVTLRQQQQAFVTFNIAAESYHPSALIPTLWLMFLSLLQRSRPSAFSALHQAKTVEWDVRTLVDILGTTSWEDQILKREGFRVNDQSATLTLSELLCRYLTASKQTSYDAMRYTSSAPDIATQELGNFLTGGAAKSSGLSLLHLPFDLVATAGLFSQNPSGRES